MEEYATLKTSSLQQENDRLQKEVGRLSIGVKKLLEKLENDSKIYKQWDDRTELRINEEFISLIKSHLITP